MRRCFMTASVLNEVDIAYTNDYTLKITKVQGFFINSGRRIVRKFGRQPASRARPGISETVTRMIPPVRREKMPSSFQDNRSELQSDPCICAARIRNQGCRHAVPSPFPGRSAFFHLIRGNPLRGRAGCGIIHSTAEHRRAEASGGYERLSAELQRMRKAVCHELQSLSRDPV